MFQILAQSSDTAPGGIGALGLNVKYLLFQLVSFLIVLLVLRKLVFPKLVATLEARRAAVEQSLDQAKETEAALRKAEKQIAAKLHEARSQAEEIVDTAHKEATKLLDVAETKATQRAQHIISEAQAQLAHDLQAARETLKHETTQLVARASAVIIKERVDAQKDAALIQQALVQATEADRIGGKPV